MLKKVIWIIFFTSVIVLAFIAFYSDYRAKQEFCELSFHGKIEQIKIPEGGLYDIKIENDDVWYDLNIFVLYQVVPIEVGDTIIKEKNCYKVTLIKNGTYYNIGNDWETLCDCKGKD